MFKKVWRSFNFLNSEQGSIFSAAFVVMVMIAVSRVLGLVRNRVLAHFFSAETLSVYFAAFRLPEVVFEILIFGALSSAFIPTFTSYLSRREHQEAWYITSVSINIALALFLLTAIPFWIFSRPLYQIVAPGFNSSQVEVVARLARILFLSQGFFILSYFLTAVLESFKRFLVPAIAPLFYNLGIILGTIIGANRWGIYAPTIGAVFGAFFHFLVQIPLAVRLGFRPRLKLDFFHPGVRKIGRLALPRVIELTFLQITKATELFFASLVSAAAYTYFTFANSLQLLLVGLFGVSVAKASLPTFSYQTANGDLSQFKKTFISLFNKIIFLTMPGAVFLAVLRIPLVRLIFGAARFTWESTVQTGLALSAFCLSIFAQALIYLLTRAFWAFQETKTPVKISLSTIFLNIFLGAVFILGFQLPIWSLALSFSLSTLVQMVLLLSFLIPKFKEFELKKILLPFGKITFASLIAGSLMFVFLKILDRSVWDKRLSFLKWFGLKLPVSFNYFVLDTRYTSNLIFLTAIVSLIGLLTYLALVKILKVEELKLFSHFFRRFKKSRRNIITLFAGVESVGQAN
jgi:putative peptidoglycan lipid II flippase